MNRLYCKDQSPKFDDGIIRGSDFAAPANKRVKPSAVIRIINDDFESVSSEPSFLWVRLKDWDESSVVFPAVLSKKTAHVHIADILNRAKSQTRFDTEELRLVA